MRADVKRDAVVHLSLVKQLVEISSKLKAVKVIANNAFSLAVKGQEEQLMKEEKMIHIWENKISKPEGRGLRGNACVRGFPESYEGKAIEVFLQN